MALFWRIWAAVVVVNVLVLSFFVGLAILRYASINSVLVGERLAVLANRTAAPFSAAAGIGLSLQAVRNAPAVLERARQTDEAIVAFHVFDAEGRVVHSTALPPPATIPAAAQAARRGAGGAPWHRETADGFLSGVEIPASGGASAGGVLVVYPLGGSVTRIWAMSAELAVAGIAVLLLSSALGAALLRLGMRRQIAVFRAIDADVSAFETRSWRAEAVSSEAPPGDGSGELRDLLTAAEERYRAAGRALSGADGGPQRHAS